MAGLSGVFGMGGSPKPTDFKPVYNSEFTKIHYEFIKDLEVFRDKYPLISLIMTVVAPFLGLSSFFSISITGLISSALYFTFAFCMASNIKEKGMILFTADVKNSLLELFQNNVPQQAYN